MGMDNVTGKSKKQLVVGRLEGYEPEIGCCLWMLEESRRRTRETLDGLQSQVIDWVAFEGCNTIGTLLYHIAAIEMDWLYNEIMQGRMDDNVWAPFIYPVRDEQGRLVKVAGISFEEHYRLLDLTRALLLDCFKGMTSEDFHRPRNLAEYDVSPEWVLHHLMQHEAHHRGEMATVRAVAEKTLGLK